MTPSKMLMLGTAVKVILEVIDRLRSFLSIPIAIPAR